MRFTWNDAKAKSNLAKHGVDFATIEAFEFGTALVTADARQAEPRLFALGLIGGRLHAAAFSIETRSVRVISLRKANAKERTKYDRHQMG